MGKNIEFEAFGDSQQFLLCRAEMGEHIRRVETKVDTLDGFVRNHLEELLRKNGLSKTQRLALYTTALTIFGNIILKFLDKLL